MNRKLFRPTLTEVKEPHHQFEPLAFHHFRAAAAQEAGSSGTDARGELLLDQADAGAHAGGRRPDRWRNSARHRRMVRPGLHQADADWQPKSANL